MYFYRLLHFLAVTAVTTQARYLHARDLATVTGVLEDVKSSIENLYKVADSGTADPAPLLKASDTLIKSIKNGKAKVDDTSALSFIDTVHLIKPVHDLGTLSKKLTDSMESLKSKVEQMQLCDVVRIQVSNISNGSTALIKAVNSKVPEAALDISNALAQGITDVLDKSQTDFSAQNCVNGRKDEDTNKSSAVAGATVSTTALVLAVHFSLAAIYTIL